MVRFARRLDAAEWEDIVQDALAVAWRRRGTYAPGRGSARTWLLMLVYDQAAKATRRRRPAAELVDEYAASAQPDVEPHIDLERAIAALTARQRVVVQLHYFLDLPVADVAAVLSIAPGTVKSTLSDARRKLRNRLEVHSEQT